MSDSVDDFDDSQAGKSGGFRWYIIFVAILWLVFRLPGIAMTGFQNYFLNKRRITAIGQRNENLIAEVLLSCGFWFTVFVVSSER